MTARRSRVRWRLVAVGVVCALASIASTRSEPERPSVLVHCARSAVSQWSWWVDLRYLSELHERGFEVDYTDVHSDLTWERLSRYDVLVTYVTPIERGSYYDNTPDLAPYRDEFIVLIERFLERGGGVFLMARSLNADETFLPLIEGWGARIPHERIEETDPSRLAVTPRMGGRERLWLVDDVRSSPVSDGVERVWLPLTPQYSANETMPIHLSDAWQVVLGGTPTSRTRPIERQGARIAAPRDRFLRPDPDRPPDLFAIRNYGRGRIAFCATWPQFSIGQGTAWLYDRRVLSKGVEGRASHFGRLIENTLRWLAQPGLVRAELGGFVTDHGRLVAPNERPGVAEAFLARERRTYADGPRAMRNAVANTKLFRGLIGARTERGGGSGDVAAHADAARRSGLDFVVFLEDLSELGEGDLDRLRADCREHSDGRLRLFAGYRLETNTGNDFFLFGPAVERPPAALLIDGRLNQQPQDPVTGKFTGRWPEMIDWLAHRMIPSKEANFGYFGFQHRDRSPGIADLRLYGMVGVELYRAGRLVEDNLPSYLTSAAGSLPAVPVAIHLVDSPAELARAGTDDVGLTRVGTSSLDTLWDSLRYAGQYQAPNVFPSSGVEIVVWPAARQYYTFAAEDFAGRAAYAQAPLVVRSAAGLDELRIYDGETLFRRFDGQGRNELRMFLELPDSIQRTLTVVARDLDGGRAVSTARRNWKGGESAPVFCGDRINHCDGEPMIARGPGASRLWSTPLIEAGSTWDGGPRGQRSLLLTRRPLRPTVVSDLGTEGQRGYANVPRLVLADEGAVRVHSSLARLYDARVPVVNAWSTFGPLDGSTRLLRADLFFTQFDRPSRGVDPYRYPGFPLGAGAAVSIVEHDLTFARDQRVQSLTLFEAAADPGAVVVRMIHGRGDRVLKRHTLDNVKTAREGPWLETGDWVAFLTEGTFNPLVQINRGAPLRLELRARRRVAYRAIESESAVREGEQRHHELLSVVDPLNGPQQGEERVMQIVAFLAEPPGLERHRTTSGLLDLEADGGSVTMNIPRSAASVGIPLPVRVSGLNPAWSAGVYLERGHVLGRYGRGVRRYRAAAVDPEGRAYMAIFADLADTTRVGIGHPVTCDREELMIQVTLKEDRPAEGAWHVSIHNPTDRAIRTEIRVAMPMPGLAGERREVDVPAGASVVLL